MFSAFPRNCWFRSVFSSPHSISGIGFLFCSFHRALSLLPPVLFALTSPMCVLVRQTSRNSGSKVDPWALNDQTSLVKCGISAPSRSLWRHGIPHLSTKGLFFSLVMGPFIRIQKLHFSYVVLRRHSHTSPRQAKAPMSVCSSKLSASTAEIGLTFGKREFPLKHSYPEHSCRPDFTYLVTLQSFFHQIKNLNAFILFLCYKPKYNLGTSLDILLNLCIDSIYYLSKWLPAHLQKQQ